MEAEDNIFGNIYSEDFLGLKENDSSINYKSLIEFLDLNKSDVSKIANVAKSSVRFDNKIPKEVQDHLDQIFNICQLVAEYFEGDQRKTALWFKTSNPLLGGVSPRDMIRLGRYKRLMRFIISSRAQATDSDEAKAA